MKPKNSIFGQMDVRRVLAALACLVLLYFAAGGTFLHQHKDGQETACHICQSAHMPALAAASADSLTAPESIGWYSARPQLLASRDSFSPLRASRAPPSA